jgi:integrase
LSQPNTQEENIMAVYKRGNTWWYEFTFAGRRIQVSAKTHSKTVAKEAERQRRRELENGFNSTADRRQDRIRTVAELAKAFLADYSVRHPADRFACVLLRNVTERLATEMSIDISEKTVQTYQTQRLKDGKAPKTINEEVCLLLRILGEYGELIRARLRKAKAIKLPVRERVGKPYNADEKAKLLAEARKRRSPAIYPALMLALNTGMRNREIRQLRWRDIDLERAFLVVQQSKTQAGEGRTIPLNSAVLAALLEHAKWYTGRFGTTDPAWCVFPWGRAYPTDPTRPITTLKTAWTKVRSKAGVTGRWHDSRHTLITELAESGAGDETIRAIAGHVSPRMLAHYSHIRMEAKRRALDSLVARPAEKPQPEPVSDSTPANSPTVRPN